jgi:glycosyltransferase involved in cell wall biosynthesis
MPAVSVLLPCFNANQTLEPALQSLALQTFKDFEVVAVDDGSIDDTSKILRKWRLKDSRFRLISGPHRGIIPALNRGLEACQGDYIARMDADDLCHRERLSRQVRFLEEHPQISVVGCLVSSPPGEEVRQGFRIYIQWLNSLVSDADIRTEIFVESPLAHPSVVLRKEWLERAGGYQDHGWAEDYDLWLRLYLAGAKFAKVPEMLYIWRDRLQRLTRQDSRYSLENFLRAKAYYLTQGPLADRDGVFIWGAGMMGRRISKHLSRQGAPLVSFVEVNPEKIGNTLRGLPIISQGDLFSGWGAFTNPTLLIAVGSQAARAKIGSYLEDHGLRPGKDWWPVA